jgi:NADH-quinone oxidoreductase subunit J
MIIISKNAITSVLYLISVFLLSSLCFLLLGAEFLSVLLIIIYIGAISILFLFVIMMLNLRIVEVYNSIINYFPIGCLMGLIFYINIIYLIKQDFNFFSIYYINNNLLELGILSNNLIYSYNNLYLIGDLLYNFYGYLLIYVALILLLAMVGAMVITLDSNYHNIQYKKINNYNNTKQMKNRISF